MSQGTSNTLAHTGWSGFGSGIDFGKASKGDSNNSFYPGTSNGPRNGVNSEAAIVMVSVAASKEAPRSYVQVHRRFSAHSEPQGGAVKPRSSEKGP